MRRKLTSWGVAIRKWSNQIILTTGALPVFWLTLPEDWRSAVVEWRNGLAVLTATVLAVAAFFVSNIKQPALQEEMKEAYSVPPEHSC